MPYMIIAIAAFLFVCVCYWKLRPPRKAVVPRERKAPRPPGESCPWNAGDTQRRGAR